MHQFCAISSWTKGWICNCGRALKPCLCVLVSKKIAQTFACFFAKRQRLLECLGWGYCTVKRFKFTFANEDCCWLVASQVTILSLERTKREVTEAYKVQDSNPEPFDCEACAFHIVHWSNNSVTYERRCFYLPGPAVRAGILSVDHPIGVRLDCWCTTPKYWQNENSRGISKLW